MSKAKAKPRSKQIMLRLTYEQARALVVVLRYVGGAPDQGNPRRLIDEVLNMLWEGREFDFKGFSVTRPEYRSGIHIDNATKT